MDMSITKNIICPRYFKIKVDEYSYANTFNTYIFENTAETRRGLERFQSLVVECFGRHYKCLRNTSQSRDKKIAALSLIVFSICAAIHSNKECGLPVCFGEELLEEPSSKFNNADLYSELVVDGCASFVLDSDNNCGVHYSWRNIRFGNSVLVDVLKGRDFEGSLQRMHLIRSIKGFAVFNTKYVNENKFLKSRKGFVCPIYERFIAFYEKNEGLIVSLLLALNSVKNRLLRSQTVVVKGFSEAKKGKRISRVFDVDALGEKKYFEYECVQGISEFYEEPL